MTANYNNIDNNCTTLLMPTSVCQQKAIVRMSRMRMRVNMHEAVCVVIFNSGECRGMVACRFLLGVLCNGYDLYFHVVQSVVLYCVIGSFV